MGERMEIKNILPTINHSASKKQEYIPEEFKKIAESMETQFIEHMLKKMQDTTGQEDISQADSYYSSLQLSERAKVLSDLSGERSLKGLILDQIYPEKYRNEIAYNAFQKSQNEKINAYNKVSQGE